MEDTHRKYAPEACIHPPLFVDCICEPYLKVKNTVAQSRHKNGGRYEWRMSARPVASPNRGLRIR